MSTTSKSKTKLTSGLQVKKTSGDIVDTIVKDLQETFKNVDFDDIKRDQGMIFYVMQEIENCIGANKELTADQKAKIDKNSLLIQIIKKLFPNITPQELDTIEYAISFIADSKLLTTAEKKNITSLLPKFLQNLF
jgi:hypothetical protein